jgi:o-succinylbenzoate synthase
MRIQEFSLPLKTPLSTAADHIRNRAGFVLRVGENPTGIGEATPLPGWTESFEECRDTLAGIEDPENALDDLDGFPAARHGLSLAVADRAAKERELPLYQYLGGSSTKRVSVNATIGDGSAEKTARAARKAVSEGFETIKCKVGARPVSEDITRVRAVREAIDPKIALRLDANGGWSREQADRALRELASCGIEYVEQPLSPEDLAGHCDLSRTTPIALDESLAGKRIEEIEAMADVADILVLKPMALGGADRTVEIGRRVEDVVVTTTIDGVIARTAAVHAAAALDLERACGLATADLLAEDLATDPTVVQDGSISVPQKPALGVEYSWGEEDA